MSENDYLPIVYVGEDSQLYSVVGLRNGDTGVIEAFTIGYVTGNDTGAQIDGANIFETPELAEQEMIKYAQKNNLVPLEVKRLAKGKDTVLQGSLIDAKDFVILSNEDFKIKSNHYFDLKTKMELLEVKSKEDIKKLKADFDSKIGDLAEEMEELEPALKSGCEEITVDASWERDTEAQKMVLIRRDNLKPLAFRDMNPEEKNPTLFDSHGSQVEDENSEYDPEDADNDNVGDEEE